MRTLIILAILGAAFAVPRQITRIVGGSDTTVETYPFMVKMQFGIFGIIWLQACGGSLITRNSVLSAAHCFEDDLPSQWRAVVGTSLRSSGGTVHNIARFTLHPEYDILPLDADVAIVHLANSVTLSPTVATISIASATSQLNAGLPVTTIGWGDTEYDGFPPEQLQHVQVYIVDQDLCAERYAYLKTLPNMSNWPDITPGMACAGILNVGGKDGCQGDSGGPVVFLGNPNILVGVTSWGYECAHPEYPGVIARVPAYTPWIVENAS